jgi:hypothetical protein
MVHSEICVQAQPNFTVSQVKVFWFVTLYSFVVGRMMEATQTSEMLLSYHSTSWHDNPEDLDLNLHHSESLKSHIYI